ncbi:hypothetical protein [Streptomyces sp. NRRL F-5123]|uniref:hypothetical protein n=1 Tax=Streptomyces sp. NRRL F-5123 TaxID=1463856 RepID=UPI0004E231B7|nr:hypothetical protein [Streptomyces sp. NRRL F-5123]
MTPAGQQADDSATTHSLWTVARICRALNHTVLERRFLTDLTHAPEPDVMSVFTAWRKVAATIEQHAPSEARLEDLALPAPVQPPTAEGR